MQRRNFKPKPHRCSLCPQRFSSPGGLTKHIQHRHTVPVALQKLQVEELEEQPQDPAFPRLSSPSSSDDPEARAHRRSASGPPHQLLPRRPEVRDRTFKPPTRTENHPVIDGTICDSEGYDFDSNQSTDMHPGVEGRMEDDFEPFLSATEFEMADFVYAKAEMSAGRIDELAQLLAQLYPDQPPPFANHKELYALIDSIKEGDVPWDSFSVAFNGDTPTPNAPLPPWASQKYEVWFRDPLQVMESQLANPEFKGKIDYAPKRVFRKEKRQYEDLMSGNWAWRQADALATDTEMHGAMFAPVVLGSDKTTVSVATGQNDFYPLYASLGNVHNGIRRSHRNALSLIGFLAIPKSSREYSNDPTFRKFRRQLFHTSLKHILSTLKPYMMKPKVTMCPDGHFRRVVYALGPYIADYPEQALLACVVQGWCPRCTAPSSDLDSGAFSNEHVYRSHEHTDDMCEAFSLRELWDDFGIASDVIPFTAYFPRADIHELLSPDLLHQLIKGTFKDHLIDWVMQFISQHHSKAEANRIMADIDRRIAAVPPFPGQRRFYEGRNFKQWTGDDSKALMKVILPALAGRVPPQMVQTVRDFLEFTYLVRRSVITEDDLDRLDTLVISFHNNREIFRDLDIRPTGFSLPRQHSMVHYKHLIQEFGAPNGLCSSITESKHIKAVKKPYRRSSRNRPLGQMLVTNQRMDKILAMRIKVRQHLANRSRESPEPRHPLVMALGTPSCPPASVEDGDGDAVDEPASLGEIKLAKCPVPRCSRTVDEVARAIGDVQLVDRVRQYIHNWIQNDEMQSDRTIPLDHCPDISTLKVHTYPSARAVFFAPSDISGIEGMRSERIRAVEKWGSDGRPRFDCVLIGKSDEPGFLGYFVARAFLFFSFRFNGVLHPCALIQWYSTVGDEPCPETGMWMVKPDTAGGRPSVDVVHLDSIFRAAHLIGISGKDYLPPLGLDYTQSLDAFKSFYVNKYADHHSHEILF